MKNVEDIYPLTPLQQGMLFHTICEPTSGVYFEQLYTILEGELDVNAFERAWQLVLDRHPALRSLFIWQDLDEPLQFVIRNLKINITRLDWRHLGKDRLAAMLQLHLKADRDLGFDLAAPPLIRLTLLRTDDLKHIFIFSHHHILLDGWSDSLLMREVFSCYESLAKGEAVELRPARPFRDYLQWLQSQDRSKAEAYWREALRGLKGPTRLPWSESARSGLARATIM